MYLCNYVCVFLLCNVLRRNVLLLGKLCLNLHNMNDHDQLPRQLSTVLSHLPLSRHTLYTTAFLQKDFEAVTDR